MVTTVVFARLIVVDDIQYIAKFMPNSTERFPVEKIKTS